jgi:hypothetical protein
MRLPLSIAIALPAALAAFVCGCATSVNDLLAELQYGDSESVREAVIELGDYLGRKEVSGLSFSEADREAVRYLEDLARKSPEPLLRASALGSLARLERPEATDLYLAALEDPTTSWVVRLEAAKALAIRPDPRASEALCARVREEPRLEVSLEILKALKAVGGETALRTLLDLFLDKSRRYLNMRLPIYDALCLLSGKLYPFEDPYAWERYRNERFPASQPEPDAPDSADTAAGAGGAGAPAGAPIPAPDSPAKPTPEPTSEGTPAPPSD